MSDVHAETRAVERLREAGCACPRPVVGERPGKGPRCRLCNTEADWTDADLTAHLDGQGVDDA